MPAIREILAHFGIEVDGKKLEEADNKVGHFIEKLEHVGKKVTEAFAVYEVWEFAKSTTEAIIQVNETAIRLGVTTDAVQALGFASKSAGLDATTLTDAMGRLQVTAANAGQAGGESGKAFAKLGIHVKNSKGELKGSEELLAEVADGMEKIQNPTKRAQIATELFGRSGRQLIPFLSKGSKGLEEMKEQFEALGGGFDEESVEAAEGFTKALAKSDVVINGIKGAIAKGLLPALTWITEKASAFGGWFVQMTKGTDFVRDSLIALSAILAPLAVEMAMSFAPVLLAAGAAALLFLVFNDLIGLFSGKKSLIGSVMDDLLGKGQSTEFVKNMKDLWKDITDIVTALMPVLKMAADLAVVTAKATGWVAKKTVQASGYVGDELGKLNVAASGGIDTDSDIGKAGARRAMRQQAAREGRGDVKFSGENATDTASANQQAREGLGTGKADQVTWDSFWKNIWGEKDASIKGGGGAPAQPQPNQINVTVNAHTDAKPHEIAQMVGNEVDKHVRAAYAANTQAAE